jgi:hypothetical protein
MWEKVGQTPKILFVHAFLDIFQNSSQNFMVFIVDATRPSRITQARKLILIISRIIWVHG